VSRDKRGLREAVNAAHHSKFYAHRVGAALFKGSVLVATSRNSHKSHPDSTCFTQHAEFRSLLGKEEDLSGYRLYVARLTRTHKVSYAKPCDECQKLIRERSLKKVFYTGYTGILELL